MAEVRKKEKVKKYNIDEITVGKGEKSKEATKKPVKSIAKKKSSKEDKKSLWVRFRIFCHGVKSEFGKVHWPSKSEMIRYSIATIFFVVFLSLFFYLIDVIFALIQSVLK